MKPQTGKFLEACRVISGPLKSDRSYGFNGAFRIPFLRATGLVVGFNADGDFDATHVKAIAEAANLADGTGFSSPFYFAQCICSDESGWDHVSVVLHDGEHTHCPSWAEMCKVKDLFFREEETVLQYHPRKTDYVNHHPHCLHLWRPQKLIVPTPPTWMVGPMKKASDKK